MNLTLLLIGACVDVEEHKTLLVSGGVDNKAAKAATLNSDALIQHNLYFKFYSILLFSFLFLLLLLDFELGLEI